MNEGGLPFLECWKSVGLHLQDQSTDLGFKFHNLSPTPPWLEHLCFNLGNRLFFVCIEDVDQDLECPTDVTHCISAAKQVGGVPCIIPMQLVDGVWSPRFTGWGLIHAVTREEVNPPKYVSPLKIEITDWELQDLAVSYVSDLIRKDGGDIQSRNSDSRISPSIFFRKEGVEQFVGIYTSRYPVEPELRIDELRNIAVHTGLTGNYICVIAASEFDPFDPESKQGFPLYRGDGLLFRTTGFQSID